SFGDRRWSRDGQPLYRVLKPDAACDHGRPAGPLHFAVRAVPVRLASERISQTLREVELRAGEGGGRTGRDRARLLHGHATTAWSDVRVDSRRRLGSPVRTARRAPRTPHGIG